MAAAAHPDDPGRSRADKNANPDPSGRHSSETADGDLREPSVPLRAYQTLSVQQLDELGL